MRKALVATILGLGLLVAVVLIKTALFTSRQVPAEPAAKVSIDEEQIARRLAEAIRYRTVSHENPAMVEAGEFLGLHSYLERAFPRVQAALTREVIAEYSLLFTWTGTDPGLRPILLMAHLDVVPVEPGTERAWTHPPFEGRIADGYVWGRGALDYKAGVLGPLEAVEMLLAQGWGPRRTIHLAFGHDEEVAGKRGAAVMAALLQSRGVQIEYVLDEGLVITDGAILGLSTPVALVGIAEKGFVVLELTVEGAGGHSSMPPAHTAIGLLSTAIHNLERRQFPARLDGAARSLFDYVGPEMPFAKRMAVANLWLSGWVVQRQLAASPSTNALIRTTTAVTKINGGVKENVLPVQARAIAIFRTLPGDSAETVTRHVRRAIGDSRIEVTPLEFSQPSRVSNTASPSFQLLQRTIHQVFPEVVVAPGLFIGATDSRHYEQLSANTFRFSPWRLNPEDFSRIHGTNERLGVADYADCIRFYVQLLRNSAR